VDKEHCGGLHRLTLKRAVAGLGLTDAVGGFREGLVWDG
jgi:hypothetical protein